MQQAQYIYEVSANRKSRPCTERTKERAEKELSVHEEIYTVGMVLEDPSMYLSEVCHELEEAMGVPPTICRLLRRYGITRKKIQQVALQRCYTLRGAFMAQCLLFNPDQFVFIDETGSDARDHIRKYGYAIRGLAPQNKTPVESWGKELMLLLA